MLTRNTAVCSEGKDAVFVFCDVTCKKHRELRKEALGPFF